MNITPWVERLQDLVPDTVSALGGAADYATAAAAARGKNGIWVIPLAERASNSPLVGTVRQRVEATVGVILAARHLRDARGEAALGELEALRLATRERFIGWSPSPQCEPVERRNSRLLEFTDQMAWWLDEYATAWIEGN